MNIAFISPPLDIGLLIKHTVAGYFYGNQINVLGGSQGRNGLIVSVGLVSKLIPVFFLWTEDFFP